MPSKVTSFAAVLSLAAGLLFSGWIAAQSYPASVRQLVAAAKRQVRTIDMATFKSAFDRNDLGLIVDVREPEEYADGYIPGAINVPRGVIELRIWALVGFPDKTDMGKKLTLYCGSGMRCILAAKSLQDLGFSDVTAADMAIADWMKAGYPLVRK
ncbi:MAG: rhodanese-like domain-containing protein [Betaproteobacteria bacterium]|nr:rhodanese-like domain-containing protein [Betaproteobacteria bacterium]